MNIFICIKYKGRAFDQIPEIRKILESLGHKTYCFATDAGEISDSKKMMTEALDKINQSDALVVESSEQSFGVGIEAGYGFAKGKKIISIIKDANNQSKTLDGISNNYIIYKDYLDLENKLKNILNNK